MGDGEGKVEANKTAAVSEELQWKAGEGKMNPIHRRLRGRVTVQCNRAQSLYTGCYQMKGEAAQSSEEEEEEEETVQLQQVDPECTFHPRCSQLS